MVGSPLIAWVNYQVATGRRPKAARPHAPAYGVLAVESRPSTHV